MFKKILIANRGEIACRVMRTCRRMGIRTVAVYSDADAYSMHVRMADEAHRLGPPPASESYLLGDEIIRIAMESGAEAIHPGYGFLSENAGFAEACEKAGIAFIGPKASTIEVMGSKARAKQLMEEAGVPLLPGYQDEDQSLETFKDEAERIGYPVLLKAAAGGGGKGMRIVERAEDLEGELASAKREAMSAFGDDRFIVEKFLAAPRHVEVQVFGDTKGDVVHLFERDCSVQRRYQKVIEEAPAPNIPDATRANLHDAAVEAARKVDYVGAGTVEFLYDGQDGVYFMEMNTRLQVEHPVTEEVTGQDLVEWQIRIAAGEALPLKQDAITVTGHAIEARLYAEDPRENYLPQTGRLTRFFVDDDPDGGIRLDTGVAAGDAVTPFYDPMVAKVIGVGEDRADAIDGLASALAAADIGGLVTNRDFLVAILRHPVFRDAPPTTKFLTEHDLEADDPLRAVDLVAATIALGAEGRPAEEAFGFRLNAPGRTSAHFLYDRKPVQVTVERDGRDAFAEIDGERHAFHLSTVGSAYTIAMNGETLDVEWGWSDGYAVFLLRDAGIIRVPLFNPFAEAGAGDADAAALSAPMPATVTNIMAKEGDSVTAGQPLVTVEAMKMETVIKAPHDGTVEAIHFAKGESAPKGALLVTLSAEG